MALPVAIQLRYWGVAALVFVLVLWALGDVIMPFVLGGAVAYFLDPVADRLQRLGLSRVAATVAISLSAVLVFTLAALLIVPVLISQTSALIAEAPRLFENLTTALNSRFPDLVDGESTLRRSLQSLGETIQARGGELLNTVLGSAASVLNVVILIVVVPVVAFYLLLDWDHMVARIDALLPRDHAPVIRQLAREIDRTIAAFIRGMGTVCLIMGIYYAAALMLVGLQFGLVVGAVAGLVTFIPYVGAILGGTLAIGLGLFQFWGDWVSLGLVVGVFVAGQAVEGNILTPRLVGSSVGLHPVWLLFALAVFGALFGFVGLLVAVPLAAAAGVLVRHAARVYQDSALYRPTRPGVITAQGESDDDTPPPPDAPRG